LSVAKIPAKKESGGDFLKQKSSDLITIKKQKSRHQKSVSAFLLVRETGRKNDLSNMQKNDSEQWILCVFFCDNS
jgi:hypothetical protein